MDLQFPASLNDSDIVGVTSPSSGASGPLQPRLDFAVRTVRNAGFEVRMGRCMNGDGHVSAPAKERAAELQAMLLDPQVRAIVPPWGSDTAIDLIDLIDLLDWEAIGSAEPAAGRPCALARHRTDAVRSKHHPDLAGTRYLDPAPLAALGEPLIVYVEAAGDDAPTICRNLHGMRLNGFFDDAAAVLVGRILAPTAPTLTQHEASLDALGRLGVPILADVDCEHWAPYLPLINGATALVQHNATVSRITQTLA
ncbi:LD-carboxypeptidase [Austwickia chelonae]|uniref:LD-carboxypeptidase n=1 Tax=Austwickia chelonae TaxID=100225 RepID=UPI000E27A0CE|nr:LD-carboxypeptidase [Austwickia chelonae]